MNDPMIICPHCKGAVHLTEAMAAPLVEATRKQYLNQIAEKDAAIALRETAILKRESDVADARRSIEAEVANKLKESRQEIAVEEAERARKNSAHELESKTKEITDLEATLKDRSDKLAEAQKAQADLMRKGRDLEEAQRALELTIEQRVQTSLDDVREKSKAAAEQALGRPGKRSFQDVRGASGGKECSGGVVIVIVTMNCQIESDDVQAQRSKVG